MLLFIYIILLSKFLFGSLVIIILINFWYDIFDFLLLFTDNPKRAIKVTYLTGEFKIV